MFSCGMTFYEETSIRLQDILHIKLLIGVCCGIQGRTKENLMYPLLKFRLMQWWNNFCCLLGR
jgi:hypothetical protein